MNGQVVLRDSGQPLGYIAVSVISHKTQILTNETGAFVLRNVPQGELRLRFKRIGFAPRDTLLTIAANGTVQLRIEMTPLAIELPAVVLNGACTNDTPFDTKPGILGELFDQVNQNAERAKLFADARPFTIEALRIRGYRNPQGHLVPTRVDTMVRGALPTSPYQPKGVVRRGQGRDAGEWHVIMPELADFADTTFTNNHCFRYAGQTRFGPDSVIVVDFEPVPRLDNEIDIKGTMYLRINEYQLVGVISSLNRIPSQFRDVRDYTVRARYREVVPGVPVLAEWEMLNRFRNPATLSFAETGQVFNIRWTHANAEPISGVK